ncbi:hypothetical protein, partial [Streptomyces cacaoi]|uniref:LexA family protein n=1 Tax=Streptomyces cacaoi TaxID=1898 RepID=UPI00374970F6
MNRRPEHLTAREEEILRAIRRSIQDRGEALSVRQMAREIGLRSPASVAYHLANLEERGALVRDGRSCQTCRLTGWVDNRCSVSYRRPGSRSSAQGAATMSRSRCRRPASIRTVRSMFSGLSSRGGSPAWARIRFRWPNDIRYAGAVWGRCPRRTPA